MREFTNSICMLFVGLLLAVATTGCDKTKSPVDAAVLPPSLAALEKIAAKGEIEAQYRLALAYLGWKDAPKKEGLQTPWEKDPIRRDDLDKFPVDEVKAALWLEKAAAQGHVGAQRELGRLYLPTNPFDQFDPDVYLAQSGGTATKGSQIPQPPPGYVIDAKPKAVRVRKDARTAIAWFTKAAANGDAESQFQLGLAYSSGTGVDKNSQESLTWYGKAAEQGHGGAQSNLALAYLNGQGAAKDPARAIALLEKAAAQGYIGSAMTLASIYEAGEHVPKDPTRAFEWLLKAAEAGWDDAQLQVGGRYYFGAGVKKDLQKAADWWRKAVAQGNAFAEYNLGVLLREGDGVPKDSSRAFELFSKSAVKGNASAQAEIGRMHFYGQGTPKDSVLGYAWTNLAAAAGNAHAIENRPAMERQMGENDIAEAQRLSSSWKLGESLARAGKMPVVARQGASSDATVKVGSGTAFVVSGDGYAITNQHVVNGCKVVRLQGTDVALSLVTADAVNDLALLKLPEPESRSAPLSPDPAKTRQGEDIVVFGFPLNSVLSSGGNLTPGVVSAVTGLGNNTNQIQITAPVQPGSSGSPVLNKKGEVVAVVSQKISDVALAKATGAVGQNVSFAVNGQTLRSFLDANQIKYKSGAGLFAGEKSTADLADAARQWTRVVECWK